MKRLLRGLGTGFLTTALLLTPDFVDANRRADRRVGRQTAEQTTEQSIDWQYNEERKVYEFANALSRKIPHGFVNSAPGVYHDRSLEFDDFLFPCIPVAGKGRCVVIYPPLIPLLIGYFDYREEELFKEGRIKPSEMKTKYFAYNKNEAEEKILSMSCSFAVAYLKEGEKWTKRRLTLSSEDFAALIGNKKGKGFEDFPFTTEIADEKEVERYLELIKRINETYRAEERHLDYILNNPEKFPVKSK